MNDNIKMRELPLECRPYERFKTIGVDKLSDAELFAIIIRNGTKQKSALDIAASLLAQYSYDKISNSNYKELQSIEGIGEVKAIEIKCVFEIANRIEKIKRKASISFSNPQLIADYARSTLRLKNHEVLIVLYLNNKFNLIFEEEYSDYSDIISVPSKKIYKNALLYNATNVVLIHNHPSGDLTPSQNDYITTEKIYTALKELDVRLTDHIIVSESDYYSFKKNNFFDFD